MSLDTMWESIATRLEGRRVVLEPLCPEHADAARRAGADPAAWRWMAVTNVDDWLAEAALLPIAYALEAVRNHFALPTDGARHD